MPITPFVNFTSIVVVLLVMFTLDMMGYMAKIGTFYIASGVLGVYTEGAIFNQQFIVNQTAYNVNTAAFSNNNVDPNLMAAVMAIVTICSFYFIFWERRQG